MSKIYKVRLFDRFSKAGKNEYELVGDIIVKKNARGVFDVLTGFKLSVFKEGSIMVKELNDNLIKKMGHQPFISQADLVQKNLATPEDIDFYVDGYDTSKWKNIYEQMKIFTIADRVVIRERVKSIYKSKKNKTIKD